MSYKNAKYEQSVSKSFVNNPQSNQPTIAPKIANSKPFINPHPQSNSIKNKYLILEETHPIAA
jgi:hypothetical protein